MRRPGIDAELAAPLAEIKALLPPLTLEGLSEMQGLPSPPVEQVLEGRAIDHEELEVPGPDGAPDVKLSVYRPSAASAPTACMYWIHGGGMIIGDRFTNIELPMDWVDDLGITLVSVEYRLAPAHQGTALVDDCYAGLAWVGKHAGELGVDPGRIVVAGGSAGGGLAAGVTLMARDRGEPECSGSC